MGHLNGKHASVGGIKVGGMKGVAPIGRKPKLKILGSPGEAMQRGAKKRRERLARLAKQKEGEDAKREDGRRA